MKHVALVLIYVIVVALYAFYSYALLDPNLVLNSHPLYWQFQQFMWSLGYHQRFLSLLIYTGIITLLIVSWKCIASSALHLRKSVLITALFFLCVAHPALSHDVFNYMFNAKMLVKYQLDPHVHVALEISSDPWLRFMHNVHTPAPYGHAWTYFSVVPYVLGFEKFTIILFNFKLLMLIGWIIWLWILRKIATSLQGTFLETGKDFLNRWWVLAFCPLILLEHVGTMHNDLWMMIPLLASYLCAFVALKMKTKKRRLLFAGIVFFLLSVWMKIVSIVVLPILATLWILVFASKEKNKIFLFFQPWWADASALAFLIPLITARSQQFHPWYLAWSLSFYPFVRSRLMRAVLIAFSISSLYRYLPFLSIGEYSDALLLQQRLITWLGALGLLLGGFLLKKLFLNHRARMKK